MTTKPTPLEGEDELRDKIQCATRGCSPDDDGNICSECIDRILALIRSQVSTKEREAILIGRKFEADDLKWLAQNDDRLTPDEYEAILSVLNARLDELEKPGYPKGAGKTA